MVTIRPASLKDLKNVQALNEEIMVNNPKLDSDFLENFAFTSNGEKYFRECLLNKDGGFFIAEEDNKMVGYANGSDMNMFYRKSKYFEIENIGVVPDKKRKGIGGKLLEHITEYAKRKGYQKIHLSCYSNNKEALDFYSTNGFSQIDVGLEKEI